MIPERSIESILAAQLLRELKDGETCSYDSLKEKIGKDPQGDGYGFVMTARRAVEREGQCVFEAIANEGIKRLAPREVLNRGASDIGHLKRSQRWAMNRQITLVPIEKQGTMQPEERSRFLTQLSHLGILGHLMKPKSVKRLEAACATKNEPLPTSEILRLFAPNGKENEK